ncbi:MAG: class II glutamine amidotransferase [Ruminococcus sp.]|nr:class II glutamine amidotransferase [Ruminococcus sp.]
MCAVFGFLDYKNKVKSKQKKALIKELSIAAEERGTDATGIAYIKNGDVMTFKKASPAHKLKLYFPAETKAVIGHTRMTTQGSEKWNYNNHPFEGKTKEHAFALAHNGVLWNDRQLRCLENLPQTKIETDSYIAVQLLEQGKQLNAENIKRMAELLEGSFVFTILRDDNTLFLVKGSNPLTLYHFPKLGLYVYASMKSILNKALKKSGFAYDFYEVDSSEGDILAITPDGEIKKFLFEMKMDSRYFYEDLDDAYEETLMEYCGLFGVDESDVRFLLDIGYQAEEIEEMFMDTKLLEEAFHEAKTHSKC